jgi:hypothetical protein
METIDRELVKNLRGQIQDAIERWWDQGGENLFPKMEFRVGNATFTESNVTFKIEVALVGENGEVKSKEAESFKKFAVVYGLKEEDFGKSFKSNGHTYKICGLKTKSGKYPVIAERDNGRRFKFGAEYVKLMLSVGGEPHFLKRQ